MKNILILIACVFLLQTGMAQKIDRSKQPTPGPAPVISIPDPVMYKLSNGITVLVVENHKFPKVSASYSIDAGPVTEGDKAGVLGMMGQMMNEGTVHKTKAEFDEAVDQMGATVGLHSGGGSVSALTRYFEKSFLLMTEALQQPAMPQASFDKIKSQSLTALKADEKSVKAVSKKAANALLYGKKHPMGEMMTEVTLGNITLADVKTCYAQYISPSRGYLTFIGDITPAAAKALAEKAFADWKGNTLTLPVIENVSNPAKAEINVVDMPNAVQSEIRVSNLINLPLSNPDYFPLLIANQILGGGANAYLFLNLREKYGFTYGAYSNFSPGRYQTTFTASAAVRNEKTDSSVMQFVKEISRIRNEKVNGEDLKNVKAEYNGSFALDMENPGRIASFASDILLYNLPKDFYRTFLQKINAVTAEDVQRVAKKYFTVQNARIIITGKASQIVDPLKKLGYTVTVYDQFAEPVKETATGY